LAKIVFAFERFLYFYPMSFFTADYLSFFKELAANNHKEWFDANRKRYETSVKEPFKAFTQHLIDELAKKEPAFKELKASDCIFL